MRESQYYFGLFLMVLIISLFAQPITGATVNFSKEIIKATQEEFNIEARTIRPEHPLASANFAEYDGKRFYYLIPRRIKRLCQEGDRFTIKKIRYNNEYVSLELESNSGAKPRIHIYAELAMTQQFFDVVIPGILRDVFIFREPWSPQGVVGNSQSMKVHWASSNHLPTEDFRVGYPTIEEAQKKGYLPCSVCFQEEVWIPLEGYSSIRKEAVEAARLREVAFPPVEDEGLQAEIQALGSKIVNGFPVPPMGYEYQFKVLHSEIPWAQSYPTGFVYVSDSLLEVIEDPLELEFVLAHEIAHVELFIKETSKNPLADSESGLGASSYQGYYKELRNHEHEIDFVSLVYLAETYRKPQALHAAVTVLRKLQNFGEPAPQKESGDFDSHPTFIERATFLDNNFFIPFSSFPVFCNLEDGETVLTAEVLGVVRNEHVPRIVIRVSATDLMNKVGKVRIGGEISIGDGKLLNLEKLPYPEMVGRNQSRIFLYDIKLTRFADYDAAMQGLANISGLDLGNIGGADDWGPCEETGP